MARGTGYCEHDGHVLGDQASGIIIEGATQRFCLVHEGQPDAWPLGVMRRQIIELEIDQDAAFIRPPVVAKDLKVAPAAMVAAADRKARDMDRAARFAQMRAGYGRQLLELDGVDIEYDTANRAFTTSALPDQVH